MNARDARKQYEDAVRNLSSEQISVIESGGFCETRLMQYAQQCYRMLVRAEKEECGIRVPTSTTPHQAVR
jgi:hypothetical protein